jgi:hypothetical protein
VPENEDTKRGTHPDMVMQDDISPLEIPTPEDAYRRSMEFMGMASGYFSQTNSFNDHAQFNMAKAMVWARLANVASFGSVLLESGPPWVNYNDSDDENLAETKKAMMLGEEPEEDDGRP